MQHRRAIDARAAWAQARRAGQDLAGGGAQRSPRRLPGWLSVGAAGWLALAVSAPGAFSKPTTRAAAASEDAQADVRREARQAAGRGMAWLARGEHARALGEFQAAVALLRVAHGGRDHPHVAATRSHIAVCLDALERPQQALPEHEAALAMWKRLHPGPDSSEVAIGHSRLAGCLSALGRSEEGLRHYRAAAEIFARLYKDQAHPARVKSLADLGNCLLSLHRPAEALPHFQNALGVCRKLYGDRGHPFTAASLNWVGICQKTLGRYAEALPNFEAAVRMYRTLYEGRDHPTIAMALNNVGFCLANLGRLTEALPRHEAAVAMLRKLYKNQDHFQMVVCLSNLGYCLKAMCRPAEALRNHQAAFQMRRRLSPGRAPGAPGGDQPELAEDLNQIGHCLADLGRHADALSSFRQFVETSRRLHGPGDHPTTAMGLNNVAGCLLRLGRVAEGLSMHEAALQMLQRLHKHQDHPSLASCLSNVAHCLAVLGRPDEALPKYRAALAMRQRLCKGQDHPDVAASLNNLGACLWELGRKDAAATNLRAALAMYQRLHRGRDHPTVATCLSNVAHCQDAIEQTEAALRDYQAALAMDRRLYGSQAPGAPGGDHPAVAHALYNVGMCLVKLGRRADALATLRQALAMSDRLHDPQAFLPAAELGWLYLKDPKKADEAAKAFEKAIAGLEAARREAGGTELDRARYFAHIRRGVAFGGMVLAQLALGRREEALAYAERGRALSLREMLARGTQLRGGDLLNSVEAAAKARGQERLLREAAAARLRESNAWKRVAALTAELQLIAGRHDLRQPERAKQHRRLAAELADARQEHVAARRAAFNLAARHAAQDLAPLTAGQIRQLLADRQWLLMYVVHRQASLLFVVPPSGGTIRRAGLKWPDGTTVRADDLAEAVTRYLAGIQLEGQLARGAVRTPPSRPAAQAHAALGHRLFRALIPPGLWKDLGSAEQVYVVPDGALHRLPFEALIVAEPRPDAPSAKDRRYWLDAGPALAYGPSATVLVNRKKARSKQLARLAKGVQPRRKAVLLGDPVFQRLSATRPALLHSPRAEVQRSGCLGRHGTLRPLPGTRREVQRIYQALTGREYRRASADATVTVLLGEDATRTKLFQAAPGSRYLHLATHGLVDFSQQGIYSSLALTQPATASAEDFGFLSVAELFDQWGGRLEATELVVLSACDTQRGHIEPGEGVFGLSWGFLYAGAPAVIASLWPVPDKSTAEMMGELYAELSPQRPQPDEHTKLRAFVHVRQALRRKHPEPYFWAPFVYVGDPR